MSNKSKLITGLLLVLIIVLVGSVFYITTTLTGGSKSALTSTPTRKTIASPKTYNKLIAINQGAPSPAPTGAVSPVPTEIILAYQNPTATIPPLTSTPTTIPTGILLVSPSVTQFPVSPTSYFDSSQTATSAASTLPETGFFNASLLFLTLASGFITLAFLF